MNWQCNDDPDSAHSSFTIDNKNAHISPGTRCGHHSSRYHPVSSQHACHEALYPTRPHRPESVAQITAGRRNGLVFSGSVDRWSVTVSLPCNSPPFLVDEPADCISPVGSGANFSGLRLGRACSDPRGPPGLSGSFSSLTFLRHSLCQVCSIVGRLCRSKVVLSTRPSFADTTAPYCHLSKNAINSLTVLPQAARRPAMPAGISRHPTVGRRRYRPYHPPESAHYAGARDRR